jgi:hypothetical protein
VCVLERVHDFTDDDGIFSDRSKGDSRSQVGPGPVSVGEGHGGRGGGHRRRAAGRDGGERRRHGDGGGSAAVWSRLLLAGGGDPFGRGLVRDVRRPGAPRPTTSVASALV